MEHYDDPDLTTRDVETTIDDHETHATTGGAAVAGAVTGGVIGLTGGPVGAVVGAVGGAIVGAAAERMMHSDDESDRTPAVGTPDTSAPTTSDITTTPAASAGDRGSISVEHDEEDETR
jgi:phage tail tape-measure protein